jgi:hypothetical protein
MPLFRLEGERIASCSAGADLVEGKNATSSEHPVPYDGGRHDPDAELAFGKPRKHSLTFQEITIGRCAMSAVQRSNDLLACWRAPERSRKFAVAVKLRTFESAQDSFRHAYGVPLLHRNRRPTALWKGCLLRLLSEDTLRDISRKRAL